MTTEYRTEGERFFASGVERAVRMKMYFGGADKPGLLQVFRNIKKTAADIRILNQNNMERAVAKAKHTAAISEIGLGIGLAVTAAVAAFFIWGMALSILRPIQAVTQSAIAIGAGNFNQAVPVISHDEIGHLAEAFNLMTRQLRSYRESHSARLLRVQRTSQATIDSFPDPVLVVDPTGCVEMANPAAHHLLGVAPPPPGQPPNSAWMRRCPLPPAA